MTAIDRPLGWLLSALLLTGACGPPGPSRPSEPPAAEARSAPPAPTPLPLAGDPTAAARGATVYREACAECHGASGAGDGPSAVRLDPPPADLRPAALRRQSDARLFEVITRGQPGTSMPAFAATYPVRDRWAVVLHLRLLGGSPGD